MVSCSEAVVQVALGGQVTVATSPFGEERDIMAVIKLLLPLGVRRPSCVTQLALACVEEFRACIVKRSFGE